MQQMTRQARRLYVGNLPPDTKEHELGAFFNQVLMAANAGGASYGPGEEPVLSVYLNLEKKFGFVEFKTMGEATAAMSLDGVMYQGVGLKIRRPSDYNPSAFAHLSQGPVPTVVKPPAIPELDPSKLGIISTQVPDGPNKVFCGGLPYDLGEQDIKELVSTYGPLKAFHLVKEKDVPTSKGYCFFEYANPDVTDAAIAGLNGIQIGAKTLTVRRAMPRTGAAGNSALALAPGLPGVLGLAALAGGITGLPGAGAGVPDVGALAALLPGLAAAGAGGAPGVMPGLAGLGMPAAVPTRILVLKEMVTPQDLVDDQEYKEILEDVEQECGKYGQVLRVVIPRPDPNAVVPGLGKVFVEFAAAEQAAKARAEVEGRQFASRTVAAEYLSEEKWAAQDLS